VEAWAEGDGTTGARRICFYQQPSAIGKTPGTVGLVGMEKSHSDHHHGLDPEGIQSLQGLIPHSLLRINCPNAMRDATPLCGGAVDWKIVPEDLHRFRIEDL